MDPLAEEDYEISPYAYCGNNPVNRIDPDGRMSKDLPEHPRMDERFFRILDRMQKKAPENFHYYSDNSLKNKPNKGKIYNVEGDKEKSGSGIIMCKALSTCSVLLLDDNTIVGVVDDVAIPFILVKGIYDAFNITDNASDSGKSEKHGDRGRAKTKTEKQIQELENKLNDAKGNEKMKLKKKIDNIKRDAQRKAKGEEHSRGNKR